MKIFLIIVLALILSSFAIRGAEILLSYNVSWYGPGFHGKITANGEIYNQNDLTCASPTVPFNTRILVTNIENGKSVIVRVNDRGPFKMDKTGKALRPLIPHPTRGLDLSKASFQKIADINKGIIKVKIKIVK